jgi:hypothetical protein
MTVNDDVTELRGFLHARYRTDWQLSDEQLAAAVEDGRERAQTSGWSWKVLAGKALRETNGPAPPELQEGSLMPRRLDAR